MGRQQAPQKSLPPRDSSLERVPVFAQLSESAQDLLRSSVVIQRCSPGSTVLRKGDAISGAYLVLSGALRVFTTSSAGTEATLYFLNSGDTCVLAVNCLFAGTPYPAFVQSETAALVAVIPGLAYHRLFAEERAIQDLTLQAFSGVVCRLMSELERVHVTGQKERLAAFLVNHASQGVLQMTQQRLAGHLGTSREVVARLIGQMVTDGVISSRRGAVTIRDQAALSRIASHQ